jgi:hypothetical protein
MGCVLKEYIFKVAALEARLAEVGMREVDVAKAHSLEDVLATECEAEWRPIVRRQLDLDSEAMPRRAREIDATQVPAPVMALEKGQFRQIFAPAQVSNHLLAPALALLRSPPLHQFFTSLNWHL